MGYTANTILVRPGTIGNGPRELLRDLGYDSPKKVNDLSFGTAVGIAGCVWVGSVGDCVIIEGNAAYDLFVDTPTNFKAALLKRFPGSDIAALTEQSNVGHWGFSIYKNGTLIRCQHGIEPIAVRDFGQRLPIEESYFTKRRGTSESEHSLRQGDLQRPKSEEGHGSDIVWEIFKSFTGLAPNDRSIHDTPGLAFEVNDPESFREYNTLYEQVFPPIEVRAPRAVGTSFWRRYLNRFYPMRR